MNKIKEVKPTPDSDVVKYLEECLADAKSGKLVEFRLVGACFNGDLYTCNAGSVTRRYTMLGLMMADMIDYKQLNIDE